MAASLSKNAKSAVYFTAFAGQHVADKDAAQLPKFLSQPPLRHPMLWSRISADLHQQIVGKAHIPNIFARQIARHLLGSLQHRVYTIAKHGLTAFSMKKSRDAHRRAMSYLMNGWAWRSDEKPQIQCSRGLVEVVVDFFQLGEVGQDTGIDPAAAMHDSRAVAAPHAIRARDQISSHMQHQVGALQLDEGFDGLALFCRVGAVDVSNGDGLDLGLELRLGLVVASTKAIDDAAQGGGIVAEAANRDAKHTPYVAGVAA